MAVWGGIWSTREKKSLTICMLTLSHVIVESKTNICCGSNSQILIVIDI